MLMDGRDIGEGTTLCADVCVIGGGAAGITVALELAGSGVSVVLLESGGRRPDPFTRDLLRGESTGLPYEFADGCRGRFLGGATNYWGGWCSPFDPWDFEARSWIANSGWPVGYDQVMPYYERAHKYLHLGPFNFDAEKWVAASNSDDIRLLPLTTGRVRNTISQFSRPTRFGTYIDDLRNEPNVSLVLNATVLDLETDGSGGTVERVSAGRPSGNRFSIQSRYVVAACGGIENARLLLASNKTQPNGIGNGYDQVGRYFMDHPRLFSGEVTFKDEWAKNRFYNIKLHHNNKAVQAFGTRYAGAFALDRQTQEREGITNARVWLSSMFPGDDTETANALIRMKHRLEHRESPNTTAFQDFVEIASHPFRAMGFVAGTYLQPEFLIKRTSLQAIVEPEPDPESRVTLSGERDRFGVQRVSVDWQLAPMVRRTFDRNFAIVAEELARSGVATVALDPPLEGQSRWPKTPVGTWHHMGTTRMSSSPRKGVVDRDSLVHGMNNLYVAGSSVFPTAGPNFPTHLIVALSIRLADHLALSMARTESPSVIQAAV